MCHHVHGTLSAEDRKNVKTFAGIMIPVYASILEMDRHRDGLRGQVPR